MPDPKKFEPLNPRPKKEPLTVGEHVRGMILGERTVFNLGAMAREYKLGQAYQNVRNLDFRARDEIKLQMFRDYKALRDKLHPNKFAAEERPRPEYPADEAYRNRRSRALYPRGEMMVLVDKAVYAAVAARVDRYVLDVGRDGYWATIHVLDSGTPAEVRAYLRRFSPVGALLVGAIAVPWYEHDGDQFPCDLYYMDLDGEWSDADGDGKFDGHSGDLNPEVWIGRLYTPTADGNDAALLNDYFDRNHQFRLGLLGHARSALAYVDDDWTGFDDCAMDQMFPAALVTKYTNPATTDADLYKAEVGSLRSWVQLCAHSWPQGHALRVGSNNEYIGVSHFRDTNPPNAHFYNLFCCGPGRFTEADYLGGWYIFDRSGGGKNLGMTAVASGKSGSMLFFEDFYGPLGRGQVIGDAYVAWWQARGPDHDDSERYWYYGLSLLGDPTLSWWKGAVSRITQPQADDVSNHWPRKMQIRWDPVDVPGVRYQVEVDAFGAINAGQWAEATGQTFWNRHNISGTSVDHEFVGAQRGRCRVRAVIDGQACSWSPWSYFRFDV